MSLLKLKSSSIIATAAFFGAAGVAIGAFGAHGLKEYLTAINRFDTFETAVRYHLLHAILLLVVGIWSSLVPYSVWRLRAAWCIILGILIFSGSLYILCLLNLPWLGAITPLGGLAFIAGWLALARAAYTQASSPLGS